MQFTQLLLNEYYWLKCVYQVRHRTIYWNDGILNEYV